MSVTLKVYFTLPSGKQEIRRFTTSEPAVLSALQSFLSSIYEKHFQPHPLRFVLQFDDGEDLCSISTEAELQDALKLHAESGSGAMKILAAFDTAPAQEALSSAPLSESATATPFSSPAPAVVPAPSAVSEPPTAPASPSQSEGVVVVEESDNEYERIDEADEATAAAEAAAAFVPLSEEPAGKASPPVPSAPVQGEVETPAPVRVAEPETAAPAAAAEESSPVESVVAPPSVVEEDAPSQSPEVSIEDVSFASVPEVSAAAVPTASAAASSEEGPSIHSGVTCDGCGVGPIVGVRYNCVSCGPARGGFDLCQACEERGGAVKHDTKHEFAVHVKPVERAAAQQQQQQSASASAPAQSPAELVQAAVQRVVEGLSGGNIAGGASALQGAVGDVISAIQQAGQQHRQQRRECRRNWWEARQQEAVRQQEAAAAAAEQQKANESAAAGSSSTGPAVHEGITCDGCGASPIRGVRYHCQTCDGVVRGGFDLCDECESAGDKHDVSHLMVKMRVPQQQQRAEQGHCGRFGRGGFGGGRGGHHGGFWGRHGHGGPHGAQEGAAGAGGIDLGPLGELLGAFGGGRGGHHHGHGGGFWGGRGGWGGRGCHRGGPRDDSVERPRAEFVSDVTLADGLQVHAGETLRKVWSIKNVGSAPWPVGTRLIFVGGDLAPESDGRWGCDASGALVPFAAPGDIVHVEMDIVVPNEAGRFRATFRLQTQEGVRFGPRVWIDINVPEERKQQAQEAEAKAKPAAAAAASAAEPVKPEAEAPAYAAAAFASVAAPATPAKVAAAPLPVASPVVMKAHGAPVAAPAPAAAAVASKPAVAAAASPESALAAEFKASASISSPASSASSSSAAAAAAPSSAAAPAGRVAFAYPNELVYLRSMGFTDNALNKYLLLNNKGSLQAVVSWLLANAKSA